MPEGQNETLFGFVAVSTSTGDITSGNLLDAVQFRQYYRMDFQTPPSGSGTYSTDGETPVAFDSEASKSDYALVGSDVTVTAKPVDASHHFLGAYVGDTFVDADQWTANADGSYSLTRTLTANLSVRLMFSANTVVYDVNGGDPYDSDNPETGHEIYIKRGSSYTNKTAATKRNDDGWRFTGWKCDDDHILGVNHKITYGSKTNDLSISQNDQTVVSGIPAEKGITLTAQWTYRQAFATTLYNADKKTYEELAPGEQNGDYGSIAVSYADRKGDHAPAGETYGTAGKVYYTESGTVVTAVATAKEGYTFRGWFDKDGKALTTGETYTYTVGDRAVNMAYARFDPIDQDLGVSMNVTGTSGEQDRYFRVDIKVTGAKANAYYVVAGAVTGTLNADGGTVRNPTAVGADAHGVISQSIYMKHGDAVTLRNLPYGCTYQIVEKDYAADGYMATISPDGKTTLSADHASVSIENHRSGVTGIRLVNVSKTAENTRLPNATFTLTRAGGKASTFTADQNGSINLGFVPAGTYVLKQTNAPNGYQPLGSDRTATITVGDGSIFFADGTTDGEWFALSGAGNDATVTVGNAILWNLPTAAGPGLVPFALGGLALLAMAVALAFLMTRRKAE